MKQCVKCSAIAEDSDSFCGSCGSHEFAPISQQSESQQPEAPQSSEAPAESGGYTAESSNIGDYSSSQPEIDVNDNGNIAAGIFGAILFSLAGVALYFLIYQAGIIAGICGLAIFLLANFGYRIFSRSKNKASLVGLITSILVMIVMILAAEYISVSYDLYNIMQEEITLAGIDYEYSFFDAVQDLPLCFEDSEFTAAVVKDVLFAIAFGALASFGNIKEIINIRKKASV